MLSKFDDEDVFGSITIKGRIKVDYGSTKMIRQKKMKEDTHTDTHIYETTWSWLLARVSIYLIILDRLINHEL